MPTERGILTIKQKHILSYPRVHTFNLGSEAGTEEMNFINFSEVMHTRSLHEERSLTRRFSSLLPIQEFRSTIEYICMVDGGRVTHSSSVSTKFSVLVSWLWLCKSKENIPTSGGTLPLSKAQKEGMG